VVDTLPAGLESMAPGPALAALLSTVDRSRLDGSGVIALMQARARLLSYLEAEFLADVVEVGTVDWHTPDETMTRMPEPDEFSADQVGWAMVWSRTAAQAKLTLGQDLLRRLPRVFAALSAGSIDMARARVFHDMLLQVHDDIATAVVAKLIDKAGGWTCGQLRERLRYQLHKADPGWAARRYKQAVTGRDVRAWTNHDGTGSIFGTDLPVDRAAAADEYLTRLARAAKADGDVRTLAQLRADAYLDLLTGIAFRTQPSCDPFTAQADHEHRTTQTPPPPTATRHDAAQHEPAQREAAQGWAAQHQATRGEPPQREGAQGEPAQRTLSAAEPATQPDATVDVREPADPIESERFIPAHMVDDPTQAPAAACDTDHRRAYASRGASDHANLDMLCRRHHRLKHEKNLALRHLGHGAYEWRAPNGRTWQVPPDELLIDGDRPSWTRSGPTSQSPSASTVDRR
jgi:hypothetical protein